MSSYSIDHKYMQLYRDYSTAIQAFENATRDRARVRTQIERARRVRPGTRRPVGSPRDYRFPQSPRPAAQAAVQPTQVQRLYLGKILGWVELVGMSSAPSEHPSPAAAYDTNKVQDGISQKMYWNAKERYEKARAAFFDYVRRQNIETHRGRAEQALGHAANLQILGAGGDEAAWAEAQAEVQKACENAWGIYQSAPTPKSDEDKLLLIESLADAQLVGIDGVLVTQSMERELVQLMNAGELGMVRKQ
jgi:hypothetical protein